MTNYGRLAKRTVDGLICRLLLIALTLFMAALATMITFWWLGKTVDVGDWIFLGLCMLGCFGSAHVVSERRVDGVNALAGLASATFLRTIPLLVIIITWDLIWHPGVMRSLAAFLLVGYLSALVVSVWLSAIVLFQSGSSTSKGSSS